MSDEEGASPRPRITEARHRARYRSAMGDSPHDPVVNAGSAGEDHIRNGAGEGLSDFRCCVIKRPRASLTRSSRRRVIGHCQPGMHADGARHPDRETIVSWPGVCKRLGRIFAGDYPQCRAACC